MHNGRLKNALPHQKDVVLISITCRCYHIWEKSLCEVIKRRLLRWEHYPGLSGRTLNVITCILVRGRQREILQQTERRRGCEDRGRGLFQKKCNTDFRLLTSRTLRGNISGVLSHQVFGNELQQPQETNTCIQQQSLKIHETKTDSIDKYLGNSTSHLQMWIERDRKSAKIQKI